MTIYISNAFSISMLAGSDTRFLEFCPFGTSNNLGMLQFNWKELMGGKKIISAIGHGDVCALINLALGTNFEPNRVAIELGESDILIVAQYRGPRLPPGTQTLPAGAALEFWTVQDAGYIA